MKNRMRDLDFEQTVAFDAVEDFEFTRKAAQKLRQVVSLDSFEDEDADVIFHYLYKGNGAGILWRLSEALHLRAGGTSEPFGEVPQEVYRDIVVESFKENVYAKIHESHLHKASGTCEQLAESGFCEA